MLLGSLIRSLGEPDHAAEVLIGFGDLQLLAQVNFASARADESAGEYAARAVAMFANSAGDGDWLSLMARLERADDPASACLRTMIEWTVAREMPISSKSCCCGDQREGKVQSLDTKR